MLILATLVRGMKSECLKNIKNPEAICFLIK